MALRTNMRAALHTEARVNSDCEKISSDTNGPVCRFSHHTNPNPNTTVMPNSRQSCRAPRPVSSVLEA